MMISDSEEKVAHAKKILAERGFPEYIFVSSWPLSLEILSKKNGKGYALRRVAKSLEARLSIGVGDFENDEQMIRMADIGYAVANASDELKAIADRITVDVHNGAIAHIINELEKEI